MEAENQVMSAIAREDIAAKVGHKAAGRADPPSLLSPSPGSSASSTTAPAQNQNGLQLVNTLIAADMLLKLQCALLKIICDGMLGRNALPMRLKLLFEQMFAEWGREQFTDFALTQVSWTREEFTRGYKMSARQLCGFNCADAGVEMRVLCETSCNLIGHLPVSAQLAFSLMREALTPSLHPMLDASKTTGIQGEPSRALDLNTPCSSSQTPTAVDVLSYRHTTLAVKPEEELTTSPDQLAITRGNTPIVSATDHDASPAIEPLPFMKMMKSPTSVTSETGTLPSVHPSPTLPQPPTPAVSQQSTESPTSPNKQLPRSINKKGKRHASFAVSPMGKNGKQRVSCGECKKYYCDKGALKIHQSAIHKREVHYCTVSGCNKHFSSRRSRNRHASNAGIHRGLAAAVLGSCFPSLAMEAAESSPSNLTAPVSDGME